MLRKPPVHFNCWSVHRNVSTNNLKNYVLYALFREKVLDKSLIDTNIQPKSNAKNNNKTKQNRNKQKKLEK